jgi:hypothetical protein
MRKTIYRYYYWHEGQIRMLKKFDSVLNRVDKFVSEKICPVGDNSIHFFSLNNKLIKFNWLNVTDRKKGQLIAKSLLLVRI